MTLSTLLRAVALLAALHVFPSALAAQEPPSPPALRFEERAVVVSGIRPRGPVVWFSVARETAEGSATIVRREEILADDDGDGSVRFELDREVPWQSIWVAVDLTTGDFALATPAGFPLRERTLPAAGLGRHAEEPDFLETAGELAEILVVRPGQGAWGLTAGDGGTADEGPPGDRRVSAALSRGRGLGSNATALERYGPRDLILVVDPDRMEISVARLVEPRS